MEKRIIIPIFFIVFSLIGCVPNNTLISTTIIPRILTPTPILRDTNITPIILKNLELGKEYIFYIPFASGDGRKHELWGINPTNGETTLFAQDIDSFYGWSTIENKWLLGANKAIYVTDPDGSNIRKVYENQQNVSLYAWWLSDSIILINAYTDSDGLPEFYTLNIDTEKLNDITANDRRFFLVASSKQFWLQGTSKSTMEINDLSNHPKSLYNNLRIRINRFGGDIIFLPDGEHFIFIASHKTKNDNSWNLFIGSTKDDSLKKLFEPETDTMISTFRISPDGHFVAFTYDESRETTINFLNIETNQIDYQWGYPYRLNSVYFAWSPDSKFVALPYVDAEPDQVPVVHSGIQVMDITSGKTRLVLNKNVYIVGWRLYSK